MKIEKLLQMKQTAKVLATIQILAGLILFCLPNFTVNTIVSVIGFVLVFIGGIGIFIVSKISVKQSGIASYLIPILLFVLGIFIVSEPSSAIYTVVVIIGICTIIQGVFNIISISNPIRKGKFRLNGLVSVIFGVIIIYVASDAGKLFAYVIAINLLYRGIMELYVMKKLGKLIKVTNDDSTIIIK